MSLKILSALHILSMVFWGGIYGYSTNSVHYFEQYNDFTVSTFDSTLDSESGLYNNHVVGQNTGNELMVLSRTVLTTVQDAHGSFRPLPSASLVFDWQLVEPNSSFEIDYQSDIQAIGEDYTIRSMSITDHIDDVECDSITYVETEVDQGVYNHIFNLVINQDSMSENLQFHIGNVCGAIFSFEYNLEEYCVLSSFAVHLADLKIEAIVTSFSDIDLSNVTISNVRLVRQAIMSDCVIHEQEPYNETLITLAVLFSSLGIAIWVAAIIPISNIIKKRSK